MKNLLKVVLCLCFMIYVASCKIITPTSHVQSVDTLLKGQLMAEGLLQKQGITFYQYGTHVLKDTVGNTVYALTSDSINMDAFIDKKITLIANKIDGYPISGGPPYLEVIKIKE